MVKKKVHGESMVSEEAKESKKTKFNFSKVNYWMVATILLALILLIFVSVDSFSTISKATAEKELADFAQSQGVPLQVLGSQSMGSLYAINASVQGQNGTFYISKDGKYFIPSIIELKEILATSTDSNTNTPASTTIPKSDKPKVELYTWGYCPYGVQAQGPMAQVAALLTASADFEIVPYYDGHGAYETQQNKIQLCIQKLAKDKYWSYASKFVSDVYPLCSSQGTEDCDKTESIKVMKAVGIDSTKIMSCVSTDGDVLASAASAKAQQNGVSGSPTVVINGVISNAGRSAEAYKSAVCAAFNNAPSTCSSTLDSTAAAAAGNC